MLDQSFDKFVSVIGASMRPSRLKHYVPMNFLKFFLVYCNSPLIEYR